MRTRLLVGAVLLITLGSAPAAQAADAPADAAPAPAPSLEERVEAQAHLDRGKQLFGEADFVAAALEFEQAERYFATLARAPDGSVRDADADARRRRALRFAASAWSEADQPVEALDAFARLRADYAAELAGKDLEEIDATMVRLGKRIGSVLVTGLPVAASLRIDSRAVAAASAAQPIRLAAGQHVVEVELAGHDPFWKRFTVLAARTVEVAVVLAPSTQKARVRVEANVESATVTFDGKPMGNVPVDVEAEPGVHHYRVASAAYLSAEGSLEVHAGEAAMVRAALAPARPPLGLRVEPYFGFHAVNLSGSPLGDSSQAFGVRLFHRGLSYAGVAAGLDLEAQTRALNRFALGPVLHWCPTFLRWQNGDGTGAGGKARRSGAGWCPANLGVLATFGDQVGPFSSGRYSLRMSTAFEMDLGVLFLRFGGGLALEQYQRNDTRQLTGGVTFGEVSLGMNL